MTNQQDQNNREEHDQLQEKLKEAQEKETEDRAADDEKEKLIKELEQMTELAKRTMADMQNMKRRTEEERSSVFSMAVVEIIKKLIPIVDNFDRAADHVPAEAGEWYKGIELCIKDLHRLLNESGVEKIETLGKQFDPNLHEALAQDKGEQDLVIEELEAGYKIGDRVIRHAKVKVGNGEK